MSGKDLLLVGGAPAVAANYIEDVFSTYLYTGNGSTQTITNNIDLSTKGGLVWLKGRSLGYNNGLFDTVRGADYLLSSNNADPNTSVSGIPANAWITGFNANGFGLGSNGSANSNTQTYVSWTFREQPKFFDIVTYSGDSVDNRQIAHDLGSTPGCVIVRRLSGDDWFVYHRSLAANNGLRLNKTDSASSNTSTVKSVSSTTFTVGTDGMVNVSGSNYIAYLFAHDAGGFGLAGDQNVITCGSFTTNGSGTATVTLGYEPQWLMIKASSTSEDWNIGDSMRGMPNGGTAQTALKWLKANSSSAESTVSTNYWYPTATGFTVPDAGYNNTTFIYIAIRRGPMKTPTSATDVYKPIAYTGNGSTRTQSVGWPIDLSINMTRNFAGDAPTWNDRLRGTGIDLYSNSTQAEADNGTAGVQFDNQTNLIVPNYRIGNGDTYIDWVMRRAPGFFDVVCYTGTGSARTVTHNLGVTPELIIVKNREQAWDWAVYNSFNGNTDAMFLNKTDASSALDYWNNTSPTSTVFTVNNNNRVNSNNVNYVAYLFATVAGVSKVGSVNITANVKQDVNCGFTNGSRFVMVKRTDASGDWFVWDSARGIVAGNDPYLLLNSSAAEVTNTDLVDTLSSGFSIEFNQTGTWLYLAIA